MTDTSALTTTRDFLRYAISSFRKAGLVHGHGATSAVDEAAFIILESLKLPVDDINPWLDAKLLASERAELSRLTPRPCTTYGRPLADAWFLATAGLRPRFGAGH